MPIAVSNRAELAEKYRKIRHETELICSYLKTDDYQLQSIIETSPPKWHIAHVSWFFETFVLPFFDKNYQKFHSQYAYLFNSYYQTVGEMQVRADRGMLSRPCVEEIYRYRKHVDVAMLQLIEEANDSQWDELFFRVTLGLSHEQQHQELLLMDIKHNFSVNPLKPAYRSDLVSAKKKPAQFAALQWLECEGGIFPIGHDGPDFCFDNETPQHDSLVRDHKLATRLVTNAEYLEFIEDNGYKKPEFWLADGWYVLQKNGWTQPLYWQEIDSERWTFTLAGLAKLDPHQPVCHISFYEADAYARWAGKRLPLESELELQLLKQPITGNFMEANYLQPQPSEAQWYGDVWQWTASPYSAYPGFQPLAGSMGEYNGKFMCNQLTLRGGCCVTPQQHMRPTYRNFFYPHDRWPFAGLRLAEDAS